MRKWLWALALLLLAGLALAAACGDDDEETSDTQSGENGGESGGNGGEAGQTVEMGLDDFFFEPAQLDAAPGDTITLKLQNAGAALHTFTIDELDINQEVAAGAEATVQVHTAENGELRFYCRFHEASGMEGTIKVGSSAGAAPAGPSESTSAGGGYYGGY